MSTEQFISKAKKIHGDKYDYSKVKYVDCRTKVCIICPKHGEFWQTPTGHLNGRGCRKCSDNSTSLRCKYTTDKFIEKAKEIHGDKYDYSKVEYIDSKTKVCIICPIHGEFLQEPSSHLMGCGCPKCGLETLSKTKTYSTEQFIEKVKKVHGDKYDYSKIKYTNALKKVCVVCPKHGEFYIRASNLLSGIGCKKCGVEKRSFGRLSNTEDFIKKAKEKYGDKFDYSKVNYVDSRTKVCIICPKHGEFWQTPNDHLTGEFGCRVCSNNLSKNENEIFNFLKGKNIQVEQGNRMILGGKEIDILLPEKNIGIEYDGLKWHSEEFCNDKNYHLKKTEECCKKGIYLLHIFEDEYIWHKNIVESKLEHLLKIENKDKISARKCEVREIDFTEAKRFLIKNHIQGFAKSTIYLGCYNDKKLIGVMTFLQERENEWNLNRFATDINYVCRGVGGKLLEYFKRNYAWKEIKSFADRRWVVNEEDNFYTKVGFIKDSILPPDYRYYSSKGKIRIHKFNFRKQRIHKKYGLPLSMTESEMAKQLGFYRIYDCGLIKYKIFKD